MLREMSENRFIKTSDCVERRCRKNVHIMMGRPTHEGQDAESAGRGYEKLATVLPAGRWCRPSPCWDFPGRS